MRAMHRWTTELLDHLACGRAKLLDAVSATAHPLRGRSPAAGRWSVANVLSHLARTEGQIASMLQRRTTVAGASFSDATPGASGASIVDSFDGAAVLDRSERVEAPEWAQPDYDMSADDAMRALVKARQRLGGVLTLNDGLDVRAVRQEHFLFGELDFYQWAAFAGFHERRHTEQLREIAAALAGQR